MNQTQSHLDTEMLGELRDVMGDDFQSLIQTYLDDSEQRITKLRTAIADSSAEEARSVAHSFKGSCSNIGANALAALCKQAEDFGRDNNIDGVSEIMPAIEAEYQTVVALLKLDS